MLEVGSWKMEDFSCSLKKKVIQMKMSSEQSLLIQYSEAIKIRENLRLAAANLLNPCSNESKLSVSVFNLRLSHSFQTTDNKQLKTDLKLSPNPSQSPPNEQDYSL